MKNARTMSGVTKSFTSRTAAGFVALLSAVAGMAMLPGEAAAQTAAARTFTYQGKLTNQGSAVDGAVTINYRVFSALTGGSQIASGSVNTTVVDGLLTFEVPLGALGQTQFTGSERFLEIEVVRSGFPTQVLTPRQALRPAPYSLFALNNAFTLDQAGNAIFNVSGGEVGIGTTTPFNNRPVTIQGRASGDLIQLRDSAGVDRWHVNFNGANFAFTETGIADNRMVLAAGGNVGIGTNTPSARLDVVGRVRCESLQITGGSDIAEPYNVVAADGVEARPGMVVVIDSDKLGSLKVGNKAYDKAVAGIISGANGIHPGLTLTQTGSVADGDLPIAKVGRVWCYVDADAGGAIEPGDLLTTSETAGHAMKASDASKSNGAVLGKAMSRLEKGKGMVLVLVGLQ
jgi:hypothetical protein